MREACHIQVELPGGEWTAWCSAPMSHVYGSKPSDQIALMNESCECKVLMICGHEKRSGADEMINFMKKHRPSVVLRVVDSPCPVYSSGPTSQ